MHKLLISAVIGSLLVAGFTAPAQAATAKAGAACAKAGITQVVKAGTKTTKFTCVKSGKKLVWNKGVVTIAKPAPQPSPEPTVAPTPTPTPTPIPTPTPEPPLTERGIFDASDVCRLADARLIRRQPNNVGFPLQKDILPATGVMNLVVIPADFPDRPATGDPTSYLKEQTDKIREWYSFYSDGKLDVKFQIGTAYVRTSKPDSEYSVQKGTAGTAPIDGETQRKLAQDIISSAGSRFDYSNVDGILFYMPTVSAVDYDMGIRGIPLTTPQGVKTMFFWGGGKYHFDDRGRSVEVKKSKMWAFWIHELLHSQGLALHAPGNGFQTGLAQDQYGSSLVLSSWDIFRLGWSPDSSIACLDATKKLDHQIVLKPLELGSKEMRFGLVKLNQFEILVIESRRPIGYSKEWNQNDSGIFIYKVDVRLDNDRSGEASGDTGNTTRFDKWSYYQAPDGRDLSSVQGWESTKYLFKVGEKLTAGKLQISFKKSGVTDVVEIVN